MSWMEKAQVTGDKGASNRTANSGYALEMGNFLKLCRLPVVAGKEYGAGFLITNFRILALNLL